jgi:LuxR family maltose regulon positive regulatory protein
MSIAAAALRLASDDPQAAADALAPVLDGPASGVRLIRIVTALLLEARARDTLGDQATAGRVLEQALDITESNGMLLPFLLDPVPALLVPARAVPPPASQPRWALSRGLDEQLTDSETRVLRYLPTQLTAHEIANELFLSKNTISTHLRHLYAKLGAHSRHEAVDRARTLGLLAPPRQGR